MTRFERTEAQALRGRVADRLIENAYQRGLERGVALGRLERREPPPDRGSWWIGEFEMIFKSVKRDDAA